MLLSDVDIKRGLDNGSILISPFNEKQLGNVSYDLTVGDTFYAFKNPHRGVKHRTVAMDQREPEKNFELVEDERGYWILTGERILAHTREFAGGTGKVFNVHEPEDKWQAVTSYIQATSTAARLGLTACLCAGWGDVGYCNRWTLEILNTSPNTIFIPVGSVLAQICFETVALPSKIYGDETGSYQQTVNVDELQRAWDPKLHMLPKKLKVYT